MNKEGRKVIKEVLEDLEKTINYLNELKYTIEAVSEEEQSKYDSLPDGLQESEKGETLQYNIQVLDEFSEAVDDCVSNLENLLNGDITDL